jgi:hypothetical protein
LFSPSQSLRIPIARTLPDCLALIYRPLKGGRGIPEPMSHRSLPDLFTNPKKVFCNSEVKRANEKPERFNSKEDFRLNA